MKRDCCLLNRCVGCLCALCPVCGECHNAACEVSVSAFESHRSFDTWQDTEKYARPFDPGYEPVD